MSDVSTSADAGSAAVDSVAEPAAASQFAGAPILEVKDLAVSFGGIKAVNGLTFSVHEGEILAETFRERVTRTEDALEGPRAFVEKRTPNWQAR